MVGVYALLVAMCFCVTMHVRICDVEVLVSVNGCVEILGFSVGVFECVSVCGVRPS